MRFTPAARAPSRAGDGALDARRRVRCSAASSRRRRSSQLALRGSFCVRQRTETQSRARLMLSHDRLSDDGLLNGMKELIPCCHQTWVTAARPAREATIVPKKVSG